MANQRIRIKLKSYDHNLVDLACSKIVDAAKAPTMPVVPTPAHQQ